MKVLKSQLAERDEMIAEDKMMLDTSYITKKVDIVDSTFVRKRKEYRCKYTMEAK